MDKICLFPSTENYHKLHALLSQLKITVLETEKKEAKQKYQEALQSYVILYFGRPLEKLNVCFYIFKILFKADVCISFFSVIF